MTQRVVNWWSGIACLGFVLATWTVGADETEPVKVESLPPAAANVDFAKQIAPLLEKHCLKCHGAEKPKSGLRLDQLEPALKGGYAGASIVPGKSAESRLILLLAGLDPDEVIMPPEGTRLTRDEIALFRGWIDQGAKWPEGLVLSAKETAKAKSGREHWSFQPLKQPEPPQVQRTAWIANPIDRFILARLEQEGIEPAPSADRATLIRRLSLDLIGLPPTPEEVAAFVHDSQPDAYARLVDRLFASSHYGERWARPWLDLCHYADTDGYLTDQLRPVAWRYRQWLIDALNRDLAFDRFTVEQLAGDLLPGAGIEQNLATGFLRNTLSNREGGADLEQYRVEQIVDRTMTVSTGWLGLTVGCARCHDHKYDPISQREFFQLYAYFDSADELNLDAPLPGELEAYLAKLPEYERKRAELLQPVEKDLAELQARWEVKLLEAMAHPAKDHVWDRQWEVLGLIWGGNLGEGQLEGCQIVLVDLAKRTKPQNDRLRDYFLRHGAIVDSKRFEELKVGELVKQLDLLRKELPPLTRAPAMAETQTPRQTHIHIRGDFRTPGILIEQGVLAILPPLPAEAPKNRLALTEWLTASDNPLPARVLANRFWQEFFGRGLVLTSEDFGVQGEQPSHPELLDWLAVEFRQRGWSMKALQRLIVTSATYQQSSRPRPELAVRDPHNRLLAQQASLRLTADQVRDVTLAASGLLEPRVGGPSVFPPQPESVASEGFDNKWVASEGADKYRRALYTYIQRLSPYALNVTFDAPATSRICTRRERSNTPLQALTLLNDPVFYEAAQGLARRIVRESAGDVPSRLERAFQICVARPPNATEKARLETFYLEQLEILRTEQASAASGGAIPAPATDALEVGAWTVLCSVLLNLHEFVTRD